MDINNDPTMLEVVVVGGGPAGLQAALTLGRVHRRTVVLDDGHYRNAPAAHMHNMITRDGTPPDEFRRIAVDQLATYATVEHRAVRATEIRRASEQSFIVTLADGSELTTRAVVLATGMRDILPPIPGLEDLWGDLAAQCPFCHGHEFAGQRLALLGSGPAGHYVPLITPITDDLIVLTNGEPAPSGPATTAVRTESVVSVGRHDGGVRIDFADGESEQVAGIFLAAAFEQRAPFAAQLGLELNPSGAVRVDERGRSSVSGVYCAGDMAHIPALPMPMASVATSTAAGQMAAATAVADLIMG